MARTRGASHTFHQDDGVLLDKEGKPIPTEVLRNPVAAMEMLTKAAEPAPVVPPEPPKPPRYVCDETTWNRSMDGFDALLLMQVYLGEKLKVEMDAEELVRLHPNARMNFRKL